MEKAPTIPGSKFENLDLIARIVDAQTILDNEFDQFQKDIVKNYKALSGELLSKADINKLKKEKRPAFIHNILLPIILNLIGNFRGNSGKIEAVGRTQGDHAVAEIITSLLDYSMYQVNDIDYELSKAYLDSLIARISWVVMDWDYKKDPLGMVRARRVNPLTIKFDTGVIDRNMDTANFITDTRWFTPEELQQIYAPDNPDKWEEIQTRSMEFMHDPRTSREKHANSVIGFFDRVWGSFKNYTGMKQGFDSDFTAMEDVQISNDWYNSDRALFKTVEFHERRIKKEWILYLPQENETIEIGDLIDAKESGRYDNEKLQHIRRSYPNSIIKRNMVQELYHTAVTPALNMVLHDAPYKVQNGKFKYVSGFCFDFGVDVMETRSMVDHLVDPANSYNKRRNSMLEYIMRLSSGETWHEEGALDEYESAFTKNEIGGLKKVKKGALTQNKIERQNPGPFPSSLDRYALEDKEDMQQISGVRENSMGGKESANESGLVYNSRVAQSEIMQEWISDNATAQLINCGIWAKDLMQKFMTQQREMRIVSDDGGIEYMKVNQAFMGNKVNDLSVGEFDVVISKNPYGKHSQQQQFQNVMMVNQALMELNPAYVDPVELVKSSPITNKFAYLERIKKADEQIQTEQERASQAEAEQIQAEAQNAEAEAMENESKAEKQVAETTGVQLDNQRKRIELNAVAKAVESGEQILDVLGVTTKVEKAPSNGSAKKE